MAKKSKALYKNIDLKNVDDATTSFTEYCAEIQDSWDDWSHSERLDQIASGRDPFLAKVSILANLFKEFMGELDV